MIRKRIFRWLLRGAGVVLALVLVAVDGHPVVLRPVIINSEAVNLRFFDLVLAQDTEEALRIAAESGVPVINIVVGDRAGKVGWTIAGQLPRRIGQSGHLLSPYYRAGHDAWVRGKPTPLLPGPTRHRLKLMADESQGQLNTALNSR